MPPTPTSSSAPAMAEEPTTPTGPNAQEAMLFFNIFKNVKGQPDIDWEQVAKDSGFKNGATAKKRFYQIKVKHGLEVKTPRKARASGSDELEADETPVKSESEASTPKSAKSAKSKSTPTKAAKATPSKVTKRRKTSATTSVKMESDGAEVADSFESVESVGSTESVDSVGSVGSEPVAPETPVRTTGFIAINSPPVTPVKAKSNGRTPLPVGKTGHTSSPLANETHKDEPTSLEAEPAEGDDVKPVFDKDGVCALTEAASEDREAA